MYEKTIVCLANSRKPPSGRCIAGKVILGDEIGQWIRPISARPGHEVSEEERRYDNGKKAQLLDIVEIPLAEHSPAGHQVENHVFDDGYYWIRMGVANWAQVCSLVDDYEPAFWGGSLSTYHGINDKVASAEASVMRSSLKLIRVPNFQVDLRVEDGFEGRPGRRRVRGRFQFHGKQYLLSVTDPEIEECYLARLNGVYNIGDAVLCISLSEVWNEPRWPVKLPHLWSLHNPPPDERVTVQ